MFDNKKVAIVCDWIKDWWGAELVLWHVMEIFPKADIYSSVFFQNENNIFKWRKITTSFIQRIPFINKSHKLALTLRPLAFESMDLSQYDIVVSMCSAESKWVITKPWTLHICYLHTPTRYFWSHYHEYKNMMEFWFFNYFASLLMSPIIHKLRKWDFIASKRPDYILSNSINTKNRVEKYYRRDATVLYPWVDLSEFKLRKEKDDFYIYVWRCIPYKKFDLVVDAFNLNWKRLVIFTNTDNKLYRELKNKSKNNIEWRLSRPRGEIIDYYSRAKASLFPPEEDFGLVPVEAMACWTPVIAYWIWWWKETVVNWETWLFFDKQTPSSLNSAISKFEKMSFDPLIIRNRAEKFSKTNFQDSLLQFIKEKIKDH